MVASLGACGTEVLSPGEAIFDEDAEIEDADSSGADDTAGTLQFENRGAIVSGQTIEYAVTTNGLRSNGWTFEATAGQILAASGTPRSSSLGITLRVFGPRKSSGALPAESIASTDPTTGLAAVSNIAVATSGTYAVVVRRKTISGGRFSLGVNLASVSEPEHDCEPGDEGCDCEPGDESCSAPSSFDPFDLASSPEPHLTAAAAIALVGPGQVDSRSIYLHYFKRERSCNEATGCGPWGNPKVLQLSVTSPSTGVLEGYKNNTYEARISIRRTGTAFAPVLWVKHRDWAWTWSDRVQGVLAPIVGAITAPAPVQGLNQFDGFEFKVFVRNGQLMVHGVSRPARSRSSADTGAYSFSQTGFITNLTNNFEQDAR